MPRLPAATRDHIREDLRDVFDEINAGPGGIGSGPMSVLKHSPEMARRASPLFEYVRNESTVPLPIRELAMLTTARAKDCPYIWNRHVTLAREAGVSDELIDALRDRRPLPPMSELEAAVIDMGMDFFQSNRIGQQTFDVVLSHLGAQGLVELTTLMGFYAMLAFNANAVDLDVPTNPAEPPLPV
jgi:4-carboxymuconolactone decarboxylase